MRIRSAAMNEFRAFGRGWWVLAAASVVLMVGAGGGSPNTPAWLIVKFAIFGFLLATLLVELALLAWGWVERRRFANQNAKPS